MYRCTCKSPGIEGYHAGVTGFADGSNTEVRQTRTWSGVSAEAHEGGKGEKGEGGVDEGGRREGNRDRAPDPSGR